MTKRTLFIPLCLTLLACDFTKSGRLGLTGNDIKGQVNDEERDDGSMILPVDGVAENQVKKSLVSQPPAAPDCDALFRRNEHVETFHCADDYLTAVAAFPSVTPDSKYFVYRGLSFLLAAPEISLGLNTFLGVFSVERALPWTKNLYGDNGIIEIVSRGMRLESPLDASISIDGKALSFTPRYSAYVTSEGANTGGAEDPLSESRARLVMIDPFDASKDNLRVQLSFRRLKAFDVTDGTAVDDLANCSIANTTAPCLADDSSGNLDYRSHVAYRDPSSGQEVIFALEPRTAGRVSASELGIASGEFITLVPTANTAALVFVEQTGCGDTGSTCTTAASPRRILITLRSLVDRVTPLEIAAIQKGIAILAPLTGTSITADQLLSKFDGMAPGQFFFDFLAAAVRSARGGSNLNDVYFAFLNIAADIKKYVVDDLSTAIGASPNLVFAFPKEIFRTSQDLELTTRELRLIKAVMNVVSAAGQVGANALHLGGNLVTRELVWDSNRDDINYTALTNALNTGFMLALDEEANAAIYRETLSGQLGGLDEVIADISSANCQATTLLGCMQADYGAYYRSLVGDLKSAVDAGTSPSTAQTLSKFQLGNLFCSDSFPNTAGSCASIGATVPSNGAYTFASPQTNMPFVVDFGSLAFTSRSRAPLLTAGEPFVVKTLPNGAKHIDLSGDFFDALGKHVRERSGMLAPSTLNPNVFVSGDLSPMDPGLGGDEAALMSELIKPALQRAADTPLSRLQHLFSL